MWTTFITKTFFFLYLFFLFCCVFLLWFWPCFVFFCLFLFFLFFFAPLFLSGRISGHTAPPPPPLNASAESRTPSGDDLSVVPKVKRVCVYMYELSGGPGEDMCARVCVSVYFFRQRPVCLQLFLGLSMVWRELCRLTGKCFSINVTAQSCAATFPLLKPVFKPIPLRQCIILYYGHVS